MKPVVLIIASLFLVNTALAQSKKEMSQKITQLEEKTKSLEGEITNIKTNLTNTTTTLGLVSKSNLDLEKQVQDQKVIIDKLINQNDSLLIALKIKKDAEFVSNPKNEEDSIMMVIQSYYACKKWEDRTAFVVNPDAVKQYMKEFYADNYKPAIITKDKISIQSSDIKINEVFKVLVNNRLFYCKKTNSGFKIDWMASTGYNPISLKTFKANLSTQPTDFRVKATIGTYYNYNYRDAKNTHWNVYVSDDFYNDIQGCYISKTSVEGKNLYNILKDGKEHALILEIKIDATDDNSGGIAIITRVVQEGWSKE